MTVSKRRSVSPSKRVILRLWLAQTWRQRPVARAAWRSNISASTLCVNMTEAASIVAGTRTPGVREIDDHDVGTGSQGRIDAGAAGTGPIAGHRDRHRTEDGQRAADPGGFSLRPRNEMIACGGQVGREAVQCRAAPGRPT